MALKIILDPKDFQKIVQYINDQAVPFSKVERAVEIKNILAHAPIHEVSTEPAVTQEGGKDIKKPGNKNNSGDKS